MATKTEIQIQELKVELATLKVQVEMLRGNVDSVPESVKQIAILQTQVAELAKAKDAWGNRGWAVLQLVLAAGVGALVTYLLRPKA